jgi:hypothetical protein
MAAEPEATGLGDSGATPWTTMPASVPLRVELDASLALRDWVPMVASEAENVCVPASPATKV